MEQVRKNALSATVTVISGKDATIAMVLERLNVHVVTEKVSFTRNVIGATEEAQLKQK